MVGMNTRVANCMGALLPFGIVGVLCYAMGNKDVTLGIPEVHYMRKMLSERSKFTRKFLFPYV